MKRATLWPIGITAVLTIFVGANIALYRVAGDDPSFAVEPDYYAKAVNWDSTMAQERRNQALGWRLAPALGPIVARSAVLHVSLTDATGAAIGDATVRVAALFNARANAIVHSTLARDSTGYTVRLPVQHAGQWEFRFDVRRGRQHFTAISHIDAVTTASAGHTS